MELVGWLLAPMRADSDVRPYLDQNVVPVWPFAVKMQMMLGPIFVSPVTVKIPNTRYSFSLPPATYLLQGVAVEQLDCPTCQPSL